MVRLQMMRVLFSSFERKRNFGTAQSFHCAQEESRHNSASLRPFGHLYGILLDLHSSAGQWAVILPSKEMIYSRSGNHLRTHFREEAEFDAHYIMRRRLMKINDPAIPSSNAVLGSGIAPIPICAPLSS
jgi:hypothetical protein